VKVGDDKHSGIINHQFQGEEFEVKAQSIGYVYNQKDKSVGAEFTCEWSFS
jgi:hypothetical protein